MATKQPNILVIWGDDIGWFNVSAYNHGVMGYRTPNIDRIGKEGAMFTDWYGQQSCTAGRAAFITGQSPIRTGLTKVGLPGADQGLRAHDVTIAELLKPQGYVTGQFGKNHLGDKNEFLPTSHGFDEFFGNLYHLNAEEEPENPDYPKNPEFKKSSARAASCTAGRPTRTIRPRTRSSAAVGKQKIENTGPLTTKRMETVNDEFTDAALDFIDRAHKADKPFFVWANSTRMHIFTHLKPSSIGKTGLGTYPDGMVEHDEDVKRLLDKLDELGIADNTLVMYSTDNGPEEFSWPDGGTSPFRGEKDTNWDAGLARADLDALAGRDQARHGLERDLRARGHAADDAGRRRRAGRQGAAAQGLQGGRQDYKVHLDGYNLVPYLKGEVKESPRKEMLYWSDDGDLMALRYGNWKAVFKEQRAESFAGLVGADGRSARAEDLQPAQRSVREGGQELHLLQRLAAAAGVPARAGPGVRGASGSRASRNFRRARSLPASASTRSWRS